MTTESDSNSKPKVETKAKAKTKPKSKANILPVLPLRDVVVFPHMVIPLFVGREKSIKALEQAMEKGKQIFLVAQHDATDDDPDPSLIYDFGAVANILQMLKLPDGTVKVLVEGASRAQVLRYIEEDFLSAEIVHKEEGELKDREGTVLMRAVNETFENYVKLNTKIPSEVLTSVSTIEDGSRMADTIAAHLNVKNQDKQTILSFVDPADRLEYILNVMENEIDLLKVEKRIRGRVKKQMEKSQREYYLNEQMKAIQKELGDMEEGGSEIDELIKKINDAGMPKEVEEKAMKEVGKLKMMSPMSAEATVLRNYLDVLLEIPWKKRTRMLKDLSAAEQVLEADHYGLEKVKERILEYLAVQKRLKKIKGPILCLVGPPGVGKTSLGKSIARATNRKFQRMSLGGVRDEAEIRGHRRTYIGAMPGKIIHHLTKAGVKNPVIMLDEVDKMAMDFRGDPSSALLEVLDPEQNNTFSDHYLEVDTDLSEVMFIATANTMNIPGPLLDRMEVINLSGYTEDEKFNIAKRYLVDRKLKDNGLKEGEVSISDGGLLEIIRGYTREAGVRNVEREISKVFRKVVKSLLLSKKKSVKITEKNINEYLGVRKFRDTEIDDDAQVGRVNGLAWTSVGGELLTIETAVVAGKGKQQFTGKLGEVMQESIQAAMTVVRSRSAQWGVDPEFYQKMDVHIHVPDGATPKDGPSAGAAMCTALVSALTNVAIKSDVAMTGEITLRGEVTAIGGLKEKLLAALRAGVKTVLIPKENEKDLQDIPDNVKEGLKIIPVKWIDEVMEVALVSPLKPLPEIVSSDEKGVKKIKSDPEAAIKH
ncbi:MAG: ATP-dependent Lon protease [Saprospiraceae bacterium]